MDAMEADFRKASEKAAEVCKESLIVQLRTMYSLCKEEVASSEHEALMCLQAESQCQDCDSN